MKFKTADRIANRITRRARASRARLARLTALVARCEKKNQVSAADLVAAARLAR